MHGVTSPRALWSRLTASRPAPAVATLPVVAITTGGIYLTGGLCVLAVVLIDRPERVLWLALLPAAAVVSGVVTLVFGRRFPRWLYHGCVISGNVLVTTEVIIGHGLPVVGAALPIYVLVVVDAAFFFPLWGLFLHLAHVLLVMTVVLPLAGVPWQTVVTFSSVCVVVGVVIAWLCRAADAAEQDPLTHLANRRGLDRCLAEAMVQAGLGEEQLCLVLLDLDGFKAINDREGHQRGDDLLRACARSWQRILPPNVTMGRYGGDEFALVHTGASLAAAADLADRLRAVVPPGVSASAGVATWEPGDSPSMLMSRADVALYDAKSSGRDQTAVYGDPNQVANELEIAIERGEMVLHFQPVVRLSDRSVVGAEALVRWQHPTRGLVPPLEFVSQAERSGAIGALGVWTLHEACRVGTGAARDIDAIAVNVSILELRNPDYAETVRAILAERGMPASRFVLEVTEGVYDEGDPQVAENLHALRSLGVRISIDDFGSGYSSLRWLDRLPFDVIKIDGSFIERIADGEHNAPLLEAILAIARPLGARVIAECVETEHQARVLADLGYELGQGYLFGRPEPIDSRMPTT